MYMVVKLFCEVISVSDFHMEWVWLLIILPYSFVSADRKHLDVITCEGPLYSTVERVVFLVLPCYVF